MSWVDDVTNLFSSGDNNATPQYTPTSQDLINTPVNPESQAGDVAGANQAVQANAGIPSANPSLLSQGWNLISGGNGIGGLTKNLAPLIAGGGLANALFGKVMGLDDYFNIAHAGDSTEETMGLTMATKLEAILPGTDVLLFTGGGDDFAGDQFEIFLNDNAGQPISLVVNMDRLRAGFALTLADYERLVEIRDRRRANPQKNWD